MARLNNLSEMKLIYDISKQVYCGDLSPGVACKVLQGQVSASEASLKMYFYIYACMRKGTCYKMGTSAAFTEFIIESIMSDFGTEAILIALSSAKQNADYRIRCNNEQPGIEKICRELISKHKLKIKYEDLDMYFLKGNNDVKKVDRSVIDPTNITHTLVNSDYLKVRIAIGAIVFEAEGPIKTVIGQERVFSKDILPNAIASLDGIYEKQKKATNTDKKNISNKKSVNNKSKTKGSVAVGVKIARKHKNIVVIIKEKMDFKAKMIPLLYLATENKYQTDFSIREMQKIMHDAIGLDAEKRQVEDVLTRRSDWFELTAPKPRRYKLLDIGKDYARNILQE